MLDGQIGDTAPGVDPVGCHDSLRRTDIDAGAAASAMILHRRVGFQCQIGIYLTEKKPGTVVPMQDIAVFALPADAGFGRQRFLEYRGAVGEYPVTHRAEQGFEPVGIFLQSLANQLVVVAPECVTRDVSKPRMVE